MTQAKIADNEPTPRKRLYVHIGTHKTGSTSAQKMLAATSESLKKQGYCYFTGKIEPANHIELYLAAMRPERDSFARDKYKLPWTKQFETDTKTAVRSFIEKSKETNLIFSTEGLSLLRHTDELNRLRNILDADKHDVIIVLVLRNRDDFLRSYKDTLLRHADRSPSQDKNSALYVEPDSWLADYDQIRRVYSDSFGPDSLRVVDYDDAMSRVGNILPDFLNALDLDTESFGDVTQFQSNRSSKLRTLWARYVRRARP